MKLSVSLPDDDVAVLDEYARTSGLPSRSAALHRAVQLLRRSEFGQQYSAAWEEWEGSGNQALWDRTVADGLTHAAR